MADDSSNKWSRFTPIPRVLADFGGRRKVFERRLKQMAHKILDRRTGKDRRSGFDRRSAVNQRCEDLKKDQHHNRN